MMVHRHRLVRLGLMQSPYGTTPWQQEVQRREGLRAPEPPAPQRVDSDEAALAEILARPAPLGIAPSLPALATVAAPNTETTEPSRPRRARKGSK